MGAGIGYYLFKLEQTGLFRDKVSANPLGVHVQIGLQYFISSKLSILTDARFAFASVKDANSLDEVSRIKRDINREREDMDTISRAGAGGFAATMAAGFLDPVILIPVAGPAVKSARVGGSVLSSGLATADEHSRYRP